MRTIFLILFSCNILFSQSDSLKFSGNEVDTIIVKSSPVVLSKQMELTSVEKQIVRHYFYVKPYAAYTYFYNDYSCIDCKVLSQAYSYSIREKGGFMAGVDLGFKFKKYNFLLGYALYSFYETALDYKNNITLNNQYTQHQVQAKVMYEFNLLKFFTIGPWVGIGLDFYGLGQTTYPKLVNDKVVFIQSNNYHTSGKWSVNAGLEFRFFNSKPISPYVGYGFAKTLNAEIKADNYSIGLDKYVSNFILGVLIKF